MLYAWVLFRHTVTTTQLWAILEKRAHGKSIKSARQILGMSLALETFYHLLRRVCRLSAWIIAVLKVRLATTFCEPRDPLRRLATCLRRAFPFAADPLLAFQWRDQRTFVG